MRVERGCGLGDADVCVLGVGDDFGEGLGAEDGVAALALAAFDGFEEEGRGLARVIGDEAAVGEDGGELVGEEAEGEGDGEGVGPLVALDNETK